MIDAAPPPLWDGFDPALDTRVGAAWRAMWAVTGDAWVRLGELARAGHAADDPPLADRTIRSMVKSATALEALEVRTAPDGRHREVRRR